MKNMLSSNPDVLALAMIVALGVPTAGFAKPKMQFMFASDMETERSLVRMEERSQRVWQRLEDRMREFEKKFNTISGPRVRTAVCEGVESD